MLQPARVKYRKQQKGRTTGKSYRANKLNFGEYGLKATTCGKISSRQIEAARIAITRHAKRGGKVWIRIYPDKPVTKKPLETRMGKGKGAVEFWVAVVRPGRIMYEIGGVTEEVAVKALQLAAHKLSIKSAVVKRGDIL